MTYESITLSAAEDNSSVEPTEVQETEVDNSIEAQEPKTDNIEADTEEASETQKEDEIVLDKFKGKTKADISKSYAELEKLTTGKSNELSETTKKLEELQSRLEVYNKQESEAKTSRELEAKQKGYASLDEQEIAFQIKDSEFLKYAEAFEGTNFADEGTRDKVRELLLTYQNSGGSNYSLMKEAKRLFPADVVESIAKDVAIFESQKKFEHQSKMQNQVKENMKAKVNEVKEKYPDLMKTDASKTLLGQALNITNGELDLEAFNKMFSDIRDSYRKEWETELEAKKENSSVVNSLNTPTNTVSKNKGKETDWTKIENPADMQKMVDKYYK